MEELVKLCRTSNKVVYLFTFGGVVLNLYIIVIILEAIAILLLAIYKFGRKSKNTDECTNALQEILDGNYSYKIKNKGRIQEVYNNITSMLLD